MKTNKKITKEEIKKEIEKIFSGKPPQDEIKKIKKLAMSKNIKLTAFKKTFCKKCFTFFNPKNSKIRIKKRFKIIKCENCGYISRWRMR